MKTLIAIVTLAAFVCTASAHCGTCGKGDKAKTECSKCKDCKSDCKCTCHDKKTDKK